MIRCAWVPDALAVGTFIRSSPGRLLVSFVPSEVGGAAVNAYVCRFLFEHCFPSSGGTHSGGMSSHMVTWCLTIGELADLDYHVHHVCFWRSSATCAALGLMTGDT